MASILGVHWQNLISNKMEWQMADRSGLRIPSLDDARPLDRQLRPGTSGLSL